ncbi:TadE family protein [Actinotalea sp. C106]|uniref:TadE family protein n=1 Tax=Actinotalea sp. C106 TaxID=2908644 RepID=UPI00202771C6|nr:TadE family protein [Actinotalea sp. C106]
MSPRSEGPDQLRSTLPQDGERGAAIVDFVLVGALTTLLFAAVLQLALTLHVRSTLIDCAAEGARYGALADRDPAHGADRARELIQMSLSPRFAQEVTAQALLIDGLDVVRVEVNAPLPLVGLLGPSTLTVDGHALDEAA